jgi:microsomal dipeptidase-like Zn-dependent dipeptidase
MFVHHREPSLYGLEVLKELAKLGEVIDLSHGSIAI